MFRSLVALWSVCFVLASSPAWSRVNLPDFSELAETAGSAVVNLSTVRTAKTQNSVRELLKKHPLGGSVDDFLDQFQRFFKEDDESKRQRSMGSGFLISKDGYIVTNNHVVEDAQEIKVSLRGTEKPLEAKLVGRDPELDLALVKIDDGSDLPFLEFGDSAALKVGAWVVAIGNPFGLQNTVTAGIVSAKGRVIGAGPFDDFLQTDASINPGNSGGPLLDLDGKVVGINSAVVASAQGIGFAIPADMAKQAVADLMARKEIKRGWLGVTIQNVDEASAKALGMPEARGALVSSVMEGEPAAKAGVRVGDVILAMGGRPVRDAAGLLRAVAGLKPGGEAELTVWRKGVEEKLTATLGQREMSRKSKDPEERPAKPETHPNVLGLSLRSPSADESEDAGIPAGKGLLVAGIDPDGPASDSAVRVGDIVLEVNQVPVGSLREFETEVRKQSKEKGAVMLYIRRAKRNLFATLLVEPTK
ncbi:DegQ family serine endoprotease [Fundidesulfovibrio butyratiphilus]